MHPQTHPIYYICGCKMQKDMAKYNVKDFASAYKQKANTVKSWVQRGKLIKDADGYIDTENAINKSLISEMQLKVNANLIGLTSVKKQSESKDVDVPLNSTQKAYLDLDLRKKIAETESAERQSELRRMDIEKKAGKSMPVELVEKIFSINIQSVFRNLESENENIASLYVLERKELSIVMEKQKIILSKAIEKAKEDALFEIESAIMEYQEVRSRGEKK